MNRKHLAILLTAALLLLTAAALAETSGDYEYIPENGTATITLYSGSDAVLTVPAALDGIPVTAIGETAFMGSFGLTSLTVPEGITAIGEEAFFCCDSLTSVSLPDSLVTLGAGAFYGCSALEAIVLPRNVAVPTANPFPGCAALTEITVAPGNTALEIRDGLLFSRADGALVCWPQGLAAGVCAVPDGTLAIGEEAFFLCEDITAVTLPDSVTAVRKDAFRFCTDLTSVTLPAGLTELASGAFEGCSSLTAIDLPDGLTAIAPWLLKDCWSLTAVTVPEGVRSVGMDAFENCAGLTRIILPGSLTEVGAFAFCGCDSLTDVYFGGTQAAWDAVSADSFNDPLAAAALHLPAPRAADAVLPEDLITVEGQAFADLREGALVSLPDGVRAIADDAFPAGTAFIAPPGSWAETWAAAHGYTVWFREP